MKTLSPSSGRHRPGLSTQQHPGPRTSGMRSQVARQQSLFVWAVPGDPDKISPSAPLERVAQSLTWTQGLRDVWLRGGECRCLFLQPTTRVGPTSALEGVARAKLSGCGARTGKNRGEQPDPVARAKLSGCGAPIGTNGGEQPGRIEGVTHHLPMEAIHTPTLAGAETSLSGGPLLASRPRSFLASA
jgi:hypothetical protein